MLEYGIDALEMHADALAHGARVLRARRPAGHRRHGARVCDLVADSGAVIAGCAFLVELTFLGGRERLDPYPVHAVLEYDA